MNNSYWGINKVLLLQNRKCNQKSRSTKWMFSQAESFSSMLMSCLLLQIFGFIKSFSTSPPSLVTSQTSFSSTSSSTGARRSWRSWAAEPPPASCFSCASSLPGGVSCGSRLEEQEEKHQGDHCPGSGSSREHS